LFVPAAGNAAEKTTQSSSTLHHTPEIREADLPPAQPVVNLKLQYEIIPEVSNAHSYIKYVPKVYKDHPVFNFCEEDYEITVKDKAFLKHFCVE